MTTMILVLAFSGCSASRPDQAEMEPAEPYPADSDSPPQRDSSDSVEEFYQAGRGNLERNQKLIQNGSISLEVMSPQEVSDKIDRMTADRGGYISEINQWQINTESAAFKITVRIPAEVFSEFHWEVIELGTMTNRRLWSTDVTEEYLDIQARLDNLKTEEAALRRLLDEAQSVDEVLSVRNRLSDTRGRIDSLKGRFEYLNNRINYSTLLINLRPESLVGKTVRTTGFNNFAPRLTGSFIRGVNLVLNAASWALLAAATALPALLLLTVLLAIIWRVYRGLRKKG